MGGQQRKRSTETGVDEGRSRTRGSLSMGALEESLPITTGHCDLAIAIHARKMHKNLFVVVHPEVIILIFFYAFS
jgi:hypothetical protein